MPTSTTGRLYAYERREHLLRTLDRIGSNGSPNPVTTLDNLASFIARDPLCLAFALASPDHLCFFATPEELDGMQDGDIERLAMLRGVRLLERVKDLLARRAMAVRAK
ncbi:MAG: hypothetical protein KGN33_18025 [Paracoccaceae bacterium]|nr:hypothetical protein [Paracoccaceae bacterium]